MVSTVAIFGMGYSESLVQHLPWMRSARQVVYRGDIDPQENCRAARPWRRFAAKGNPI